MARKVFFSFHFDNDAWRAGQVRNMGVLEADAPCTDNDWEKVKKGGDSAIEKWIANQLYGKSCAVVLVGSDTASRPWVIHEIQEAWNAKKGVVGIRIHGLKNHSGYTSTAGSNPFDKLTLKNGSALLSSQAQLKWPSGATSTDVYSSIRDNIDSWVEEAITIRNNYT